MIQLDTPLQYLKGVGPKRAADLKRVGLHTVEDLLYRFPLRYEDRGNFKTIAALRPGVRASVVGEVVSCGVRPTRRPGFRIFEMLVRDATGAIRAVFFNQPFLADVFHPHQQVILFGELEITAHGLQIKSPEYEILKRDDADEEAVAVEEDEALHTGRIVAIYEKVGSVTPKLQREFVHRALEALPSELPDPVPAQVRERRALMNRRQALMDTHFPPEGTPIDELNLFRSAAQRRLIFEEFLLFQAGMKLRKNRANQERKPQPVIVNEAIRASARRVLPFRLTDAQRKALLDIVEDMQKPHPMNRLLQGDVGSGKTIVALIAAVVAMENHLQVAFMAPTEILAEQHYITIRRILESTPFRIALLTGTTPARKRREMQAELAGGSIHMVIGTHALVEDPVTFHALGLVIIDEQHRFGVVQRAALREKGMHPDVLVMTATPIPRSLALTVYGDLEVSTMRELPPGRRLIKTEMHAESARERVYAQLRQQVDAGRQAYVIYPLVEESEKVDLRAATQMADHLAHDVFPDLRVALLHGRMKSEEKERVMASFARGDTHVLVSTTVVEVGVDVPNASLMIVEHAERFGLAQLHQLRGRVGRGEHQSFCVLLYQEPLSADARERLHTLTRTNDGFVIAEKDLQLRGAGDYFGTRQSGTPTFRVGDPVRDTALLTEASEEAHAVLEGSGASAFVAFVNAHWEQRFGLVRVG